MSHAHVRILCLLFLWVIEAYGTSSTPPPPSDECDSGQLKTVNRRLAELRSKVNILDYDVRKYLRQSDSQNKGIQQAVSNCTDDIERLMGRTRRDSHSQPVQGYANLDEKLDDLSKKLQLTIATLRLVDFDLGTVKKNLTDVLNITTKIWDKLDLDSSIQNVFKTPSDQTSSGTTPKNCKEIKQKLPMSPSGIYLVQPESAKPPFMVFCDMAVKNGGWLTIHNRYEGNQEFYLDWQDYKVGFGNIAGEFWLGLEKIYDLTGHHLNELLIEIVDSNQIRSNAHYTYFSIGSEEEGYSLKVLGGYKGNAGDALSYHAGSKFSTKDKDHDSWSEGNCAQSHSGAWWYKACDKCNLNGRYLPGQQPDQFLYQAMYWESLASPKIGLVAARMLIRPKDETSAMFNQDFA